MGYSERNFLEQFLEHEHVYALREQEFQESLTVCAIFRERDLDDISKENSWSRDLHIIFMNDTYFAHQFIATRGCADFCNGIWRSTRVSTKDTYSMLFSQSVHS